MHSLVCQKYQDFYALINKFNNKALLTSFVTLLLANDHYKLIFEIKISIIDS